MITAPTPVLVMAVAEAARVPHIRGFAVAEAGGGDSRILAYASDHRLLQRALLLGCTVYHTGAVPISRLGTQQARCRAPTIGQSQPRWHRLIGLGQSVVVALEDATWGLWPTVETGKLTRTLR
jgi:hypothetical protein